MIGRDAAHYARWVRRVHELEAAAPIDVDDLAQRCRIPVHECELTSALGLLLRVRDKEGILLANGQDPRQRRFTLAHELGHACIPSHRKKNALLCDVDDVRGHDLRHEVEREANQFAAELLAPRKLVWPMIDRGAISIRTASAVGQRFDISLTAAAIRLADLSRYRSAVVLSDGDRVRWSIRRNGFPFGLPGYGDPIPAETAAADVSRGKGDELDPVEVEAYRRSVVGPGDVVGRSQHGGRGPGSRVRV